MLTFSIWAALKNPRVQSWLIQKITNYVASTLKTELTIGNIDADLFNHLLLNKVVLKDRKSDTLLYAGSVKLYLSDLLFIRKTATITALRLEQVKLNVKRTGKDSTFNFQFILDELGGSKTGSSQGGSWQLNIQKVYLTAVAVKWMDDKGPSIEGSLAQAQFDFNSTDFKHHKLLVNDIHLNEPKLCIQSNRLPQRLVYRSQHDSIIEQQQFDSIKLNPAHWFISLKTFEISAGQFTYADQQQDTGKHFSTHQMDVAGINLSLNQLLLHDDTIKGVFNELSFAEHRGFQLNHLTTHFEINPQNIVLNELAVITPYSHLGNRVSLAFNQLSDLANFVDLVHFETHFANSLIGVEDLRFFTDLPSYLNEPLLINGLVAGTVGNIKGSKLELAMGASFFKGKFKLKGLPDITNTYIDFTTEQLQSSGDAVLTFLPQTQNPELLHRLGQLYFQGNFSGFISDFVAQGTLQTSIGTVSSDVNLKITAGKLNYSGSLSSEQFDLGKLLNRETQLGAVTLNTEVVGEGWLNDHPKVNIKGSIVDLDANHYHYKNVQLDGLLTEKIFEGTISAADPNADFTFNGNVHFGDSIPSYNFASTIRHIDFNHLHLSETPYEISNTAVNLNASGSTVDNFNGSVQIDHLELKNAGRIAHIKQFNCVSTNLKQGKHLAIHSDFLNADIAGRFNYEKLPAAFSNYLNTYFPAYIPFANNQETTQEQQFTFAIELKENAELVKFFLPELTNYSTLTLDGTFSTNQKNLALNGSMADVTYAGIRVKDLIVTTSSAANGLIGRLGCSTVYSNDSILIDKPAITFLAHQDSLAFSILTNSTHKSSYIAIEGLAHADTGKISTQLFNSVVMLNNELWSIDKNNNITYKNGIFAISNLLLKRGDERIQLETYADATGPSNFRIDLNQVNIHPLSLFAFNKEKDPVFNGIASGSIELHDVFKHLKSEVQLQLHEFVINNDTLGFITATLDYDDTIKHVNTELTVQNNYSQLAANGFYNLNDSLHALNYSITLNTFNLRYIEPLIQDILSNKKGLLTGVAQLNGSLKKPSISADCHLNYGATRVNYLGTTYTMDPVHVTATNSILNIEPFTFYDSLHNAATFAGSINLQNLKGVLLDFSIDAKNLCVLNTTYDQNQLFYGKAFAEGAITIKGITYALTIAAKATTKKGTSLYIPIADDRDVNQHDFIQFISSKSTATQKPIKKYVEDLDGITLDFDINATPDAEIVLLMDLAAGDYVKARGDGNIKIKYSTFSTFEMFGDYSIHQGDYYFTFLNTVNKEFNISKGSIVWNGNPYNATIDLTASYSTRAAFYDLLSESLTTNEEILSARKLVPVNVELKATGSLRQPEINFDILTPNTNSNSQVNFLALQKLQKIKEDQNELNNQVFGLMVLNRFLPTSNAPSDVANPFLSASKSTITELASIQVSKRINDAFYRFTKDDKTQINLNYRLYDATTDLKNFNEVNFNISHRFFNDRLVIDGGVIYDYGKAETNNTNLAGDFLLEYSLTPDGRFKLKGYKKTEYDILSERNKNRTGLGVSYHQEFDTFEELWNAIIKKK